MDFLKKNAPLFTFGILLFAFVAYIETRIGRVDKNIKSVRTELKADIKEVRTELKSDIQEVRAEVKALNNKIDALILSFSQPRRAGR